MTASAFALTAVIPTTGFVVTEGEPILGGLRDYPSHYFCAYCMSWIFTQVKGFETFVNVRPTMLDYCGWFVPFIETYTSEKLPWAATPAVYSFEQFPELEEYAGLAKEYQKRFQAHAPGVDVSQPPE